MGYFSGAMLIINVIYESVLQAFHQLSTNRLRTFLSLLGISIGIFCIIAVKSSVDSLENNIMDSMDKLGNDVLYISKMPWAENPNENYWKYFQRPSPDMDDLKAIEKYAENADITSLSLFLGSKSLSFQSSNVEEVFSIAVTEHYADILSIGFESGRWFTPLEYQKGVDMVIIGSNVKELLFSTTSAINKAIKIDGIKYKVIGVIEKSGNSLINPVNFDEVVILSYNSLRKRANINAFTSGGGSTLSVKAKEGSDLGELKDEVTGILRAKRRIRPSEGNNFAVNELSILGDLLGSFFGVVNMAGFAIGLFALLVGMFSVVNIMFVSVKERTSLIGIKKALGAKRIVILLEFMIEAVILCLVGGAIGLAFVLLLMLVLDNTLDFGFILSWSNVVNGIVLSVIIGVLAGVFPAYRAAKLDAVEAMRK